MFNVSALLLDDTLKPATPLTNGAINEMLRHTQNELERMMAVTSFHP